MLFSLLTAYLTSLSIGKKKFDKTKDCVRCKVAQGNIVVRYAVYCKYVFNIRYRCDCLNFLRETGLRRECFFRLITFKFRRSLEPFVNPKPDGPRKTALKPAGGLLVGFSGGLGSTVLLDLVHRCYVSMDKATMPTEGGRDHPRHERVWKKVSVCYIEVCDAIPGVCRQLIKLIYLSACPAINSSDICEVDEG